MLQYKNILHNLYPTAKFFFSQLSPQSLITNKFLKQQKKAKLSTGLENQNEFIGSAKTPSIFIFYIGQINIPKKPNRVTEKNPILNWYKHKIDCGCNRPDLPTCYQSQLYFSFQLLEALSNTLKRKFAKKVGYNIETTKQNRVQDYLTQHHSSYSKSKFSVFLPQQPVGCTRHYFAMPEMQKRTHEKHAGQDQVQISFEIKFLFLFDYCNIPQFYIIEQYYLQVKKAFHLSKPSFLLGARLAVSDTQQFEINELENRSLNFKLLFDGAFNIMEVRDIQQKYQYMQKSYTDTIKRTVPKIICIGKNYIKHVLQMGGTEYPKQPMFFMKPWTSIAYNPETLSLPIANKHRIDHELELGVFIQKGGSNIPKQKAMEHVGGYFIALDLSDRDYQKIAKQKGNPWTLAKGQDKFCPVSEYIDLGIDPYKVQLHLQVNEQTRQKDTTGNMHFKIDHIIAFCSQFISLTQGDLILTGTPDGVGPIKIGDFVHGTASIEGKVLAELKFKVTQ